MLDVSRAVNNSPQADGVDNDLVRHIAKNNHEQKGVQQEESGNHYSPRPRGSDRNTDPQTNEGDA